MGRPSSERAPSGEGALFTGMQNGAYHSRGKPEEQRREDPFLQALVTKRPTHLPFSLDGSQFTVDDKIANRISPAFRNVRRTRRVPQ
jgi:hypothetical protein